MNADPANSPACPACGATNGVAAGAPCPACGARVSARQPIAPDPTMRRGGRSRPSGRLPIPGPVKASKSSGRIKPIGPGAITPPGPRAGSIPPPPTTAGTIPPPPAPGTRPPAASGSQSAVDLDVTLPRGRRGGGASSPGLKPVVTPPGRPPAEHGDGSDHYDPTMKRGGRSSPALKPIATPPARTGSDDTFDPTMKRGGRSSPALPPIATPPVRQKPDDEEFDPTVKRGGRTSPLAGQPTPPRGAAGTPTPKLSPEGPTPGAAMVVSGTATGPRMIDGIAEYDEGDVVENRFEVFGSAAGGMGRVLFVRDRQWKTDLAVKSLLRFPDSSPDDVADDERMFLREAMTWLQLGAHPHIVSGYFARQLGGTLRFFMEFVPGGSLRQMLSRTPALDPPVALELIAQLCEGMRYVHEQTDGRPHRDLKPDNCLIDEATGALKITDFGLLKGESDPAEDNLRLASQRSARRKSANLKKRFGDDLLSFQLSLSGGGAMGTPHYMPPEQWEDAHYADATADVYAAGVMLYEMVAGRRPFEVDEPGVRLLATHAPEQKKAIENALTSGTIEENRDPESMLRWLEMMHVRLPVPDPREFRPDTPGGVAAIIAKCLRRKPGERFRDFEAMGKAVRKVYKDLTGGQPRTLPAPAEGTLAAINNMALSFAEMGLPDRAVQQFEAALTRDRTALVPWLNRRLQMVLRMAGGGGVTVAASELAKEALRDFKTEIEPARGAEIQTRRAQVRQWGRVMQSAAKREPLPDDAADSLIFLPMISGQELAQRSSERDALLAKARQLIDAGQPDDAYTAIRRAQALLPERRREPAILQLIADVSRSGLIVGVNDAWQHARVRGGDQPVRAVIVLDDGAHAITGDDAGTLRLFGLEPARALGEKTLPGHGAITSLALSRRGRELHVGTSQGRVWRVKLAAAGKALAFAPELAESVMQAPSGVRTLTTDATGALYVAGDWPGIVVQPAQGRPFELAGRDHLLGLAVTPDRQWAVGASARSIAEWDITRGNKAEPHHYKAPGETTCFALTVDGSFAIVGGRDGGCRIFDFKNAKSAGSMRATGGLTSIAVTAEGRHVAASDDDGNVTLWSLKTRKPQHQLQADNVRALAADPRGRFLLGGCAEGTLFVWQIDWEWSFSDEAVQSREQINLQASFEFHKKQKARRARLRIGLAVAALITIVSIVLGVMISAEAAHTAERDTGWSALVAETRNDVAPDAVDNLISRIRAFAARYPELADDADELIEPLERQAGVWAQAEDLRARAGSATADAARKLLPEVERFAEVHPEYAVYLLRSANFLRDQIARDERRQRFSELPQAVQSAFERIAREDTDAADRLLDLPPDVQAMVAGLPTTRLALAWLTLDERGYEVAVEVARATRSAVEDYLELDDEARARCLTVPADQRVGWLQLPVQQRTAYDLLPARRRGAFLEWPPAHRVFAARSVATPAHVQLFAAVGADDRDRIIDLRIDERDALFASVAADAVPAYLALPPRHRLPWAACSETSREVYALLESAPHRDQYLTLSPDDRTFCDELPDDLRPRFLTLPAATRRQSMQPVPGGGWAVVPPELADQFAELPDNQKRAVAGLSAEAFPVFFQLDSTERRTMLRLEPGEFGTALELAPGDRSAFLSLNPAMRAAVGNLAPAHRVTFLGLSRDLRDRCMDMLARHREAWLAFSADERRALEAVDADLRDTWLAIQPAEREQYAKLPAGMQGPWLGLPPRQRAVVMALEAGHRAAFFALPARDRSRVAALDDSMRELAFEIDPDWRSYLLTRPAEDFAAIRQLRLSADLVPAWLSLTAHERELLDGLASATERRDFLAMPSDERIAFGVLSRRERGTFERLDPAYRRAFARACQRRDFRFARLDTFSGAGGNHTLAVFRCVTWEQVMPGDNIPDGDRDVPAFEFVLIPAGTFTLGADDNTVTKPAHGRSIGAFLLGRTEMPRLVWSTFARDYGMEQPPGNRPDMPACNMTWLEARLFTMRQKMRLPSEAEWEYAARAGLDGNATIDEIPALRNTVIMRPPGMPPPPPNAEPPLPPSVVGRSANGFGLFGMIGSLEELCADVHHDRYDPSIADGSPRSDGNAHQARVVRGGCMTDDQTQWRIGHRRARKPGERVTLTGVRPVADLPDLPRRRDPRFPPEEVTATPSRPRVPEFTWLREERHDPGPSTEPRTVQVYRWDRLARALGMSDDETAPHVEWILVPGGTYLMGPNSTQGSIVEEQRLITVQPFLLARTELTRTGYNKLLPNGGRRPAPQKDRWPKGDLMPLSGFDWNGADIWVRGNGVRLPSEAEWEYAARAGTTTDYAFGQSIDPAVAAVGVSGPNGPHPLDVASFPPNGWGLYDMHGNQGEYCADNYMEPRPADANDERPVRENGNRVHVVRSGSYTRNLAEASSFHRNHQVNSEVLPYNGMRPARSLPGPKQKVIRLEARAGKLSGKLGFEALWAAVWGDTGVIEWTLEVPEAGTWEIDSTECLFRAHADHMAKLEFTPMNGDQALDDQAQSLLHDVEAEGRSWLDFRTVIAGRVELGAGRWRIRISQHESSDGAALMNLRALTLRLVAPAAAAAAADPDAPREFEGFRYLRNEAFVDGGATLPVYRCEAFAEALGLGDDETDPTVEFVLVPGGPFEMGSADGPGPFPAAWPRHPRTVGAMLVARTEVTRELWSKLAGRTGVPAAATVFPDAAARAPLDNVQWSHANRFCEALGRGLSLPSEAEWEYVARAGAVADRPLAEEAWIRGSIPADGPQAVAQKLPNAFGLYDLAGNVREYCADTFHEAYDPSQRGPEARADGDGGRVVRGGSWARGARHALPTARWRVAEGSGGNGETGFRPVVRVAAR